VKFASCSYEYPVYSVLTVQNILSSNLCALYAGEDGAPGEGGGGGGEEEGPEGQDEPAEAQAGHGQASTPPCRPCIQRHSLSTKI
jgi:hypothetical protein